MKTLRLTAQAGLALHTVIGALWKFGNSEQAAGSLAAIPHSAWLGLSGFELLCAAGLVIPMFASRRDNLAFAGALGIVAEMLMFCGVHLASGDRNPGPMIYWLVVAAVAGFVSFGGARRQNIATA